MFTRLYCTLTEHWWAQTLAPTLTSQGKDLTTTWSQGQNQVLTDQVWPCPPGTSGSSLSCLHLQRSSFLGLRLTLSARQSVNWQMLARIPVCPPFLYLLHGNPQLCFQPSLCRSPNTNGVIFFQFLRMAQRMTAASVGKTICKKFGSVRSIFDTYKDLGKKTPKNHNTKIPQGQRPVMQHITASFLLCRGGHRKRILTPLTFLYIFCTGICLCQALLCRLVFDTHEDRHSYPEHIYLESQSIKTLFISQVLIKITLGS